MSCEKTAFSLNKSYRVACCWERNTRTLLLHNKLIQKKIGLKAHVTRPLQTYIFTVFCFISLSIVPQPEVSRLLPIDEGVKSLHLKDTLNRLKPTLHKQLGPKASSYQFPVCYPLGKANRRHLDEKNAPGKQEF